MKRVGAPRGAADRIWRGSGALAHRRGAALAGWVRKGRRNDLKGPAAALGPVLRLVVLALGALALYGALRAASWLLWPLTALWCWRAWKTAEPVPSTPDETLLDDDAGQDPDAVYAALLDWIQQAIGDRQGVHLRDLLANAQAHGLLEDLEPGDLRAHLERWDIPVRKRLRVRGRGVTVGVHRDDVPAPAEAAPEPAAGPSPEPSLDPLPREHEKAA